MKIKSIKKQVNDFILDEQIKNINQGEVWIAGFTRMAMGDPLAFEKIVKKTNTHIPSHSLMSQNKLIKTNEFLKISLENGRDLYQPKVFYYPGYESVQKKEPVRKVQGKQIKMLDAATFYYAPISTFKHVARYMDPQKPVALSEEHDFFAFEYALLQSKPSIAYVLMELDFPLSIDKKFTRPCIEMFFSACAQLAIKGKKLTHPWQCVANHLKSSHLDIYNEEIEVFHKFCIDKIGTDFNLNDFMSHKQNKKPKKKKAKQNKYLDIKHPITPKDFRNFVSSGNLTYAKKALVEMGRDINDPDLSMHTHTHNSITLPLLLFLSKAHADTKSINFLLKNGANPNFKIKPSYYSGFDGHPFFFSLLLDIAGRETYNLDGINRIRKPLSRQNHSTLSLLLSKVDVNQKDEKGMNVVDYITKNHHPVSVDILDLLHQHGFDFEKTTLPSFPPMGLDVGEDFNIYTKVLEQYKVASSKISLQKNIKNNPHKKMIRKLF